MTYDEFQRMVGEILEALRQEQLDRRLSPALAWIAAERRAVAVKANECAALYGGHTVTVADVERVEARAIGHIDYSLKLALYVTELVRDGTPSAQEAQT